MENEGQKTISKEEWLKNEKRTRRLLILLLIAIITLVVLFIFYNSFIWIIIGNVAVVIGIAANLVVLFEKGKEKKK